MLPTSIKLEINLTHIQVHIQKNKNHAENVNQDKLDTVRDEITEAKSDFSNASDSPSFASS